MTLDRMVPCAWCGGEMRVAAPNVGRNGFFVLYRQCRSCAGNNLIELSGGLAEVRQHRRAHLRSSATDRIKLTHVSAG